MEDSSTNDLVIATTAERVLVTIKPDGRLIYGPDYTPDEAAAVFWEALSRRRAEAHTRELLYAHMEKLLLEAGEADLANQRAQDIEARLAADPARRADRIPAHLDAQRANEALHQAAYRLIELGRRLALRGAEDPVSEDPLNTPETLN